MADKKGSKKNPYSVSTKTPKDLKIDLSTTINTTVKKMVLSASWTCSDENYNGGQQFFWRRTSDKTEPDAKGGSKWKKKPVHYAKGNTSAKIDKSVRSITFAELNFSDIYPRSTASGSKIRWIKVWVRGQKGKYSKTKKKKTIWYDPQWSLYTMRSIHIRPPQPPVLADPAAGTTDFSKVFAWSVPQTSSYVSDSTSRTNKYDKEQFEVFYDTVWESILVNTKTETYKASMWSDGKHGYTTGTGTAGEFDGQKTITEDTSGWSTAVGYSYTRYFRVKSRGPAGDSDWKMKSFTYSLAPTPSKPTSVVRYDSAGNPVVTISYDKAIDTTKYPIQYTSFQACVVTPITNITVVDSTTGSSGTVSYSAPPESDASWFEVKRIPGVGSVSGRLDSYQQDNKMIWTRVVTVDYAGIESKGEAVRASLGSSIYPLTDPTGLSVSNVNTTTHRATVAATNNASDIAASYLIVFYRDSANPSKRSVVGIIPHGETSKTIQLPNWGTNAIDIGVQAVVGNYEETKNLKGGANTYRFSNITMRSDIVWKGGDLPLPPKGLTLSRVNADTIRANWVWTWSESTEAEISWANHEDAWESTSPPSTFNINNTNVGQWNISGLSVGEWWVRVRFLRTEGETTTYGPYSETKSIKVVSTPEIPYVMATPSVITPNGTVTLTWAYTSEDGSQQSQIFVARNENRKKILYSGTNQTSVVLKQKDVSWHDNETVNLVIQVKSKDGIVSDWSRPVQFNVASLPTQPAVAFTSGYVHNKQLTVGDDVITKDCIVSMPLIFNISNVSKDETINVTIERAAGKIVERPDETEYPVYAGDLAYLLNNDLTGATSYQIRIEQKDLIDYLDDDHDYILRVTNTDRFGQSNRREIPLRVSWTHQAVKPSATVLLDRVNYTASITPIMPESGYVEGDVCDIYRLSVDKPELVVADAKFGTTYIDRYPTIGEFGGYRIVYKTLNGDYRLGGANSNYAMTDYVEEDDYIIDDFVSLIDFGKNRIAFRYNLSLSNSWKKDFTETHYLGGAVQGDWNPGVSRTGTLRVTVPIQEDPLAEDPEETVELIRRLSVYSGICHVRTPDGSNFYANVDVNEDREEKWVTKISKVSLSITRVDPPIGLEDNGVSNYDEQSDED